MLPTDAPLALVVAIFVGAGLVTAAGGVKLSGYGDRLADRTGWGEALFGAVFFGAMISLSGVVMTAVAAADGHPELAYGNAVGGVAAQTVALMVADLAYRRANLEHAAASVPNLLFGVVLIALLAIALGASFSPDVTVLGVHPASVLMLGAYGIGYRFIRDVESDPRWWPKETSLTVADEPSEEEDDSLAGLWTRFLAAGAAVAGAGWAVARAAEGIVVGTTLEAGFVGAALMGVTNALPEAVTSVAAVRRGALTLAVGGVLGGNTFDALNLVVGDVAYRGGSLYHAGGTDDLLVTAVTILMSAILLAGLLRRQRRGPAAIGLEGVLVFAVWVGTMAILAV